MKNLWCHGVRRQGGSRDTAFGRAGVYGFVEGRSLGQRSAGFSPLQRPLWSGAENVCLLEFCELKRRERRAPLAHRMAPSDARVSTRKVFVRAKAACPDTSGFPSQSKMILPCAAGGFWKDSLMAGAMADKVRQMTPQFFHGRECDRLFPVRIKQNEPRLT